MPDTAARRDGAVERVRAAYADIGAVHRPETWIFLRPMAAALVDARAVDSAVREGADLPLAGLTAAVDNTVDVSGLPTTAACPAYATAPASIDATVVARLRAGGAVVIGATNVDQFAIGLTGTLSPHGAVRDSRRTDYISGGASSGSAVAVALGLVDVALGIDTTGSCRVPAALQGIVAIKPTFGVVPADGVTPGCRSYDCVTVLARDLDTAEVAMAVIAGGGRRFPPDAPLAAPTAPKVAVPRELPALSAPWREAFDDARARLEHRGAVMCEVDLGPILEAAELLHDGGLMAERHDAVGEFVSAHGSDVDPTVGAVVAASGTVSAARLLRDRRRLADLTQLTLAALGGCDALLIPTTTEHPTIAEVAIDPTRVDVRLGTYAAFCNVMDLCAVAVPSETADGAQFGVSVVARAGADAVALDVARLVVSPTPSVTRTGGASPCARIPMPWPASAGADASLLFVVGAHLRGQPLAHQLTDRGARWLGPARTAPLYRLAALDITPPKPGLVRVGADGGAVIGGEVWLVGTAMLGDFLAALPAPMSLGRVTLSDGEEVVGFGCALDAYRAGADITQHGDWPTYLRWVASSPSAE